MRLLPLAALLAALFAPLAHAAPGSPAQQQPAAKSAPKKASAPKKTATPAAAKKATAQKVRVTRNLAASCAPRLDDQQRGQIAAKLVEQAVAHWVKPGASLSVRPAIVPFGGDARNPITGRGPVEVFVSQTRGGQRGLFGRLFAKLNPYSRQKYLVSVDEKGRGQILERLSLAPHRRFARFLHEKIPVSSFFIDFYKSKRAAEGLATAVGASGTMLVNPALSGALFMRLATVLIDGVRTQREARKQALEGAVAWAQEHQAQRGDWPTLLETYRAYQGKLAEEGARPLGLGQFTAALSIHQL